ncbi:DUF2207 domain-containing protein [Isoptericola sp. b441]|uniref:DUF2207 domain-containing protein n=1 Tax=Actinotalea lenta TaxID=3064654 RepID=A0ABT9D865_9CELL|nr:DUF2207 domain-containing protein [Isoptericola sp. b441]MDO8107077.1 DUF2207 domain-containing protein [Isoptericola sp. b441]
MRRTLTAAALGGGALLAGAGVLLAGAAPAAADAQDVITSLQEAITLDADGTAHVVIDLTMDFGSSPNHGPYLTYVVKQKYDDTQDRVFRFAHITASSSDAPAAVDVQEDGGWKQIRIGDPDQTITGSHTYRLSYDVQGWVNPAGYAFPTGVLPHDELFLNVIGASWDVPLQDVAVSVSGPADVADAACYAAPQGSKDACDAATVDGRTATYEQASLARGEPLTIVAAWPAGTFDTAPILQERWSPARAFTLTPVTGTAAGVVGIGGLALVIARVRRRGRDRAYLGLTPGLAPAPGQEAAIGARRKAPISVQFTPPPQVHPGQLGTLIDEHADVRDVTATIIDLAVRGYLRIEQVGPPDARDRDRDWRLVRTDKPDGDLVDYEHRLLAALFAGRADVLLSELRTTFASSLARVQSLLYEDVTTRGWFSGNPRHVRARWVSAGIALTVVAVGITALLAARTHWGLVGLPLVLVGVVVAVVSGAAPARTAQGTAVLAQTEGFRRYLATAEADQLRFEEGEDLFSRYLPFAVAFGLTERWTRIFAELAARGVDVPVPTWYVGAWGYYGFWAGASAFERDLTGFTTTMDTAISAPTPGSSGGSGFSSGGGFSGGGVGGGGGGSW